MKRFVEGTDRSQSILFPEHLDDYVAEDNIVRIVEAFMKRLTSRRLALPAPSQHAPVAHPIILQFSLGSTSTAT